MHDDGPFDAIYWESLYHKSSTPLDAGADGHRPTFRDDFWEVVERRAQQVRLLQVRELPARDELVYENEGQVGKHHDSIEDNNKQASAHTSGANRADSPYTALKRRLILNQDSSGQADNSARLTFFTPGSNDAQRVQESERTTLELDGSKVSLQPPTGDPSFRLVLGGSLAASEPAFRLVTSELAARLVTSEPRMDNRHRNARRRRRHVLEVLLNATSLAAAGAVTVHASFLWFVTLTLAALSVTYVALLVRIWRSTAHRKSAVVGSPVVSPAQLASHWSTQEIRHRGQMQAAAQRNDRAAFDQLIFDLTPALARDAYSFVRPSRVDQLVALTWCAAWKGRLRYTCDAQPLVWLHGIMCAVAAGLDPTTTPSNDASCDEFACLDSVADVEGLLVADSFDEILDCLDQRQAMIIRRRKVLGPDWQAIAQEMGYPDAELARIAYGQAVRSMAAIRAAALGTTARVTSNEKSEKVGPYHGGIDQL